MGALAIVVFRILFSVLLAAYISGANVDVNRTIDDQKGDSVTGVPPLFLPTDLWNIGQTCTSCSIRAGHPIDPGQVFDGTWHDATHYGSNDSDRSVQVSFIGHAVYVYHIVVNILVPNTYTTTDLTFYIDSEYVGDYTHDPTSNTSTPSVFYHQLVYSNDSLAQGEHTFQIIASGNSISLILFDYIIYTTFEGHSQPLSLSPSTSTSSREPVRSALNPSSHLSASSFLSSSLTESLSTVPTKAFTTSTTLPNSSVSTNVSPTLPPESAHTATGAVVGGAVAGVVVVMIAASLLWTFYFRRRTLHRPIEWTRTASRSRSKVIKDGNVRGRRRAAVPSLNLFTYRGQDTGALAMPSNKTISHGITRRARDSYALSPAKSPSEEMFMTNTERLTLLTQQMRTFQAQLDDLRYARTEMVNSEYDSSHPSAAEESLSKILVALREEMSALRSAIDQRSTEYDSHGRPPSY
ncbi:hypothetical protein GY45DRAFT_1374616 [Cubamyces sp. BRFM 1775]|nr:hypothetical protein GY45DRAFT_1374616 [Cubamyces sp. BRFM 1775]